MKRKLDLELARSWLDYEPSTGKFYWKQKPNRRIQSGSQAGSPHNAGYVLIKVAGVRVLAHRLAWALAHNRWPDKLIDHINGNRDDNRIANLRPADKSLNGFNAHAVPRSKTGYRGVSLDRRRGTYVARLDRTHLGEFQTAQAASGAYESAKAEHIRRVSQ